MKSTVARARTWPASPTGRRCARLATTAFTLVFAVLPALAAWVVAARTGHLPVAVTAAVVFALMTVALRGVRPDAFVTRAWARRTARSGAIAAAVGPGAVTWAWLMVEHPLAYAVLGTFAVGVVAVHLLTRLAAFVAAERAAWALTCAPRTG